MEQAASVIRTYEMHFVPGLLQTNEYTRAVHGLPTAIPRRWNGVLTFGVAAGRF